MGMPAPVVEPSYMMTGIVKGLTRRLLLVKNEFLQSVSGSIPTDEKGTP